MPDIREPEYSGNSLKMVNDDILTQAFLQAFIGVIKVDLQTGEAVVLKADTTHDRPGTAAPLADLVGRYMKQRIYTLDQEKISAITLERLRKFSLDGSGFPFEIRSRTDEGRFQWVEISAVSVQSYKDYVLITTRNIDEEKLTRSIVDLFVYRNYDYLFLIDAKHDSYIRLTESKDNTPVPPQRGEHYTADMLMYNKKYVVQEDCGRVTANMQLPHVIEMLEQSDVYSFTSSGITEDGKWRRSRVSFIYYDKTAGLILNARTDVTQIYLEEQEKNRQLEEALQCAQHDAMTELYNQKATRELIKCSLESQYRNTAAFFFIDVDNFKLANDTLGHQKGDELLCILARCIQKIAGRSGIAGRIGGDEFLLYLPDCPSIKKMEQTAQRICETFEQTEQKDIISCSVGISVYPRDGTDYETLLRKADQALYTSKRYGKKRYFLYSCEVEYLAARDQSSISKA
ncbi:GGDEF domain-containing protein [Lachnoclostridium pacaense]|uniref:GGDEF domain-containing protein n=1 Tax=Enterocloster hominis (ex Hitch et al. 2024) TaxID=1917870 RepID=UPI001D11725A|nr:GGDEF domain-containing protein [Lachnoclostridium pacaense]MCC2817789.1 GGDEF domain-containing protein [Lachnoclostridium pacaense]